MKQSPRGLEEEWHGREPEQPGQNKNWVWLAAGTAVLLLIICVAAAVVLWWQFQERTENNPPATLVLPATPTATVEAAGPVPTITVNVPPATAVSSSRVTAAQLTTPPTIDGNLAEWVGETSYTSAFRVYQVSGWDGTEDITAVWQLGWDASYLYVAAQINDNLHVQTQSGNQVFKGDSLEIQLDTNPDGSSSLSQDNFQIHLSPGNFDTLLPSSYRFQGNAAGRWVDAPGQLIILAAQQTDTGYTLEAAIPWLDLAMSPSADKVLGLALNADDNDTPGTAVQEVMMSNVSTRTLSNPASWGTLVLK